MTRCGGFVARSLGVMMVVAGALVGVGPLVAHANTAIPVSNTITNTVVGNGTAGGPSNNVAATGATVDYPYNDAVDSTGGIAVANVSSYSIGYVPRVSGTYFGQTMTGGNIYTVAGTGVTGLPTSGVAGSSSKLESPTGVAFDSVGNLYIADYDSDEILVVAAKSETLFGQTMTVGHIYIIAGTGTSGGPSANGTPAISAVLNGNFGVAVDSAGNVYIADTGVSVVQVIAAANETLFGQTMLANDIYTVAGKGTGGSSTNGVVATASMLDYPYYVAADSQGLIIEDYSNGEIQMVPFTTGTYFGQSMTMGYLYSIAGTGTTASSAYTSTTLPTIEGQPATSVPLSSPFNVSTDGQGDVVFGDFDSQVVFAVPAKTGTLLGQSVTEGDLYVVAGTGTAGYSGDGGSATRATFNEPLGGAFDKYGDLFVSDYSNTAIREVGVPSQTTLTSSASTVNTGNSVTLTATVTPPTTQEKVTFDANSSAITGCSNIATNASGIATCTTSFASAGTESLTALASGDSFNPSSTSGTVTLNVDNPTTTTLTSSTSSTDTGSSVTLTATVATPTGGGTVAFSANGSSIGGCTAQALNASDVATCVTSFGSAGSESVTAAYSGASGFAASTSASQTISVVAAPTTLNSGYWMVASDGGVFPFGNAVGYGSMGNKHLNAPVVATVSTPNGNGYWLVASDGGVFPFGNAVGYGSLGSTHLNRPIVGMASTPNGKGYWLVAADGGVFPFGDAVGYGSLGSTHLNEPIVGIATTHVGKGYWLVAADGGVFPFGDAVGYGSLGSTHLNAPIVGVASTPTGKGYWMVAADGGVFPFGDAIGYGSWAGKHLNAPVVGMASTPNGKGYWLVAADGGVFPFGNAVGYGSMGDKHLNGPIVGGATVAALI